MPPPRASNAARLRDRFRLAQALHQQGRLAEAGAIYQEILRVDPRHADALHFLGLIALQSNQAPHGVRLIEQVIALRPNYAEAYGNLGIGYADLGRHQDALASYDKALVLKPDLADVHDNRGNALRDLGRFEDAVASHDKAIALRPNDAGAFSNRGNALRDLHRYDDALKSYDRAIALEAGFVEARCNRAIVLKALHRYDEALKTVDQVIALAPNHAEAHYGRGNVLQDLRRHEDALASFGKAIALKPDYAEAHNNYGNALRDLRRDDDALVSYGRAIALKPDYAGAYYNIGNTLAAMRREGAALINFDRAIALQPDYADAHRARGLAFSALKKYQDALDSYQRALALAPDTPWLLGDLLSAKRQICDWTSDDALLVELEERIALGQKVTPPFTLIGLSTSPAIHRKSAEIFTQAIYPPHDELPALSGYFGHSKIRIAYFSADFRDHAMMHVMIDLFGCHDRSMFELTAFSFGPDTQDEWRQRVVNGFDRFIDVRQMSDREAALLARSLEIDIAIDLMGFTIGCRTGIFSYRAAPVQVAYLGYPGTMGSPYIDYIIADRMLIPPDAEAHYSEKIVFLPDTYQVNERHRSMSSRAFTRADERLPDTGFVFCCSNNTYKIAPQMLDVWMRILHHVEGSVLWLYEENPEAAENLKTEAQKRHIAPERLIFAQRRPLAEHLARQRLAGLFLDTVPYNGHATASLALWAGLPVLTILGETFAGRVAASLLTAIGLPELIAPAADAYEARAVELATSPDRLHALKTKLEANRLTTPLFDTARFTRHIEAAYTAMHVRVQAGLAPANIHIGDDVHALRDPASIRRKKSTAEEPDAGSNENL
jgi:protein O-GlcNAc transferase